MEVQTKDNFALVFFVARLIYLVAVLNSSLSFKNKFILVLVGNVVESAGFGLLNFQSHVALNEYTILMNFYEVIQNTLLFEYQKRIDAFPEDIDNILRILLFIQYTGVVTTTITQNHTWTIIFPDVFIEGLFSLFFFRHHPHLTYIVFGIMVTLKILLSTAQLSYKDKKTTQLVSQILRAGVTNFL